MHLSYKVVGLEHAAHAVSQAQGNGHRQSLRHSHHHQRHGNHQCLKDVCYERRHLFHRTEAVRAVADEIHYYTSQNNQGSNGIAYPGYPLAQSVKLLIERSLHAVVYLYCLKHLALFGLVAYGPYTADAMAFHYLRTLHHMIGGVGGSLVEVFLVHALQANRFARQCRFVHVQ